MQWRMNGSDFRYDLMVSWLCGGQIGDCHGLICSCLCLMMIILLHKVSNRSLFHLSHLLYNSMYMYDFNPVL